MLPYLTIYCFICFIFWQWNNQRRWRGVLCDPDFWHLTLNTCSVSPVTRWNSLTNLNAIEQSAAEL